MGNSGLTHLWGKRSHLDHNEVACYHTICISIKTSQYSGPWVGEMSPSYVPSGVLDYSAPCFPLFIMNGLAKHEQIITCHFPPNYMETYIPFWAESSMFG